VQRKGWRGQVTWERGLGRRCLRPTSDASLGIDRAGLQPRRAPSQRVTALAAEATWSLMALAGARRREIDAE
jgi:hypothetical protein